MHTLFRIQVKRIFKLKRYTVKDFIVIQNQILVTNFEANV